MTNSLKAELIPSNANHLEKKTFNWTVSVIDQESIEVNFAFEHPDFISVGDRADVMKLTFTNTPFWLEPEDVKMDPIPDGWELNIHLPP